MSMIGELVVGIIGDSSGLKTAMTQATTMVGDQATQMESAVTKSFAKIGTIMAGAFSAQKVLQFVGDSITAYSTFETATTRIFAEMGDASQETRDQIIADIRQISDAYNINLSTVAAGVNEALDVKVPPEQLANFMAMAAQLSKVSEIDLSTSVRSLGQLVTLADGDYSNIGPLADALFQISESTGAGIGEISGQLGKIVPFASALGVDLDQIAAAMMTMGEQGVPARTGLSGIQSIIEELSNMGEGSLGTLFASLTGSTFQEFLANGGTLSTALEQIATWAEASNTPLTQFFASASSGNAAVALTGTHTAALAANLEAVKSGAAGVASVWDELSRTMQEKSRDMSTKVDAVKVDLGGMVKAVLDPLNEIATGILSSITGLLGSIVSLLRGDFASAWNGLKQFFTGIYDAILGVFNLAGLGDAVDKGLKQATDSFMRFLGSVGQWGANIIQSLNDGLAAAWHTVVEWFANAWDSLISALTSWMPGFMQKWLGIGQDSGAQLAQGLTDSTSVVSEAAEGIGQTIGDSVTAALEQTAADFSATVSDFLSGGLTDGATAAQTAANDVGYSIGEGLSLGITSSTSLVSDAVTTLGEGAIFDLETTFGSQSPSRVMWEIGRDVVRGLVGGIEELSGLASKALTSMADKMKASLASALGDIGYTIVTFNKAQEEEEEAHLANIEKIKADDSLNTQEKLDTALAAEEERYRTNRKTILDVVKGGLADLWDAMLKSGIDTMAASIADSILGIGTAAGTAVTVTQAAFAGIATTIKGALAGILAAFVPLAVALLFLAPIIDFLSLGTTHFTQDLLDFLQQTTMPNSAAPKGMNILPSYADGGIVSGALGEPQLAMVHGGEMVIPPGGSAMDYGAMSNAVALGVYDAMTQVQRENPGREIVIEMDKTRLARVMAPALNDEYRRLGLAGVT